MGNTYLHQGTKFSPNVNVRGNSPLGSLPFWVKLSVCVALDFVAIPALIADFASFGITSKVYGAIQALIAYLFWSSPMLAGLALIEAWTIQVIPFMTIICVWNGYKTRWRH